MEVRNFQIHRKGGKPMELAFETCGRCGGDGGWMEDGKWVDCPNCGGSGEIPAPDPEEKETPAPDDDPETNP